MTNEIGKRSSVLVTGGGRGIGRATSLLCAAGGWAVAVQLHAATRAAAETVVARDRGRAAAARLAVHADVANDAQVQCDVRDHRPGRCRRSPALVNNAGVVDFGARVDAMTPARLQRMFAINVFGSFYCAREAIRRMTTKPGAARRAGANAGGAIVNVSSAAAKLGAPGQYVDYAAAKGAIETFTLGLAKELAAEGIRVNAVRPGIIETEIHASGRHARPGTRRCCRSCRCNAPARPKRWPRRSSSCLSDAASYTTGSILEVTGGR